MYLTRKFTFAFIIFLCCLIISCNGCMECSVVDVRTLDGLYENQILIAYILDCGATIDYSVNVSFKKEKMNIKKESGEIFHAYHARGAILQKIAADTVKIIYAARDVRTMKRRVNGINFVYEKNWKKIPTRGIEIFKIEGRNSAID